MSDDPWAVVQHEDEPPPNPEPASDPPLPKADEPKTLHGTPIPMAMSLLIPPDFISAISALVGTQAALTTQIEKLVSGLSEWTEGIEAAIIAATHEVATLRSVPDQKQPLDDHPETNLNTAPQDEADREASARVTESD